MVFMVAERLHRLPEEVLESDGELFMHYLSWLSGKMRGEAIEMEMAGRSRG